MTEQALRERLQAIVDDLFTNGNGENADRLVLMADEGPGLPGRDLGGWCRSAVVDRLLAALSAPAQGEGETKREMLMNLNIYRYDGRWFAGNMPGYTGLGDTPEDALREMLLRYNTHETPNYPIKAASGEPTPPTRKYVGKSDSCFYLAHAHCPFPTTCECDCHKPTPPTPPREGENAKLIERLNWQASENGCYCETDLPRKEANLPIEEWCAYCLMELAASRLAEMEHRHVERILPCPDCRDKIEQGTCERCARQRAESQLATVQARVRELEAKWQPIKTAPKDGSSVVAISPTGRHFASYSAVFRRWLDENDGVAIKPTHWMPLPTPPEDR